jgi:Bacterial extracellular solute-binding proteins, family 3/Helix-turn-helix domain of resolvase
MSDAVPRSKRGRRRAFDTRAAAHARTLFVSGMPIARILHTLGISHATFYRYQQEWRIPLLRVGLLDFLRAPVAHYNSFPNGSDPGYKDLQVMKQVATQLQMRVSFKPVPFAELLDGTRRGDFDLAIGQIASSARRARELRLCEPYASFAQCPSISIVASKHTRVHSAFALAGLRVATIAGSLCEDWLREHRTETTSVQTFGRPDSAYAALLARRADAVVCTHPNQTHFVDLYPEFEIKPPPIYFRDLKMCAIVNRDNERLQSRISEAILALKRSGKLSGENDAS